MLVFMHNHFTGLRVMIMVVGMGMTVYVVPMTVFMLVKKLGCFGFLAWSTSTILAHNG
jgi:hypothetical protein